MGDLLAELLEVTAGERAAFLQFAKGHLNGDAARRALWQTLHSRTAQPHSTNLPAPLTLLIGREQDLASLSGRLLSRNERLFTLTGPPGIGKTRLAVEVGIVLLDHFEDGVFFVSLASVTDPDLVPAAIARALGVKEMGNLPVAKQLLQFLREKRLLLVLDNFEQVLNASPFVLDLLGACPHLKVLTTSREALQLHGEQQFPVPSLSVVEPDDLPPAEVMGGIPAIVLFVERARAVRPGFTLTEENAKAVAAICVRLDGLPLAIELVAARVKLLSPQEIYSRLHSGDAGQNLAMLTGGPRNLPARQRTLRSAIEWSYNLLSEAEQKLFARLSVFAGGSTLSAIEAICNAKEDLEIAVLDGVDSLVSKSLIKQDKAVAGESRFTMLEMIGEYAAERMGASEEEHELRRLHAEYYLALAEAGEQALVGASQRLWILRLEGEHDNLRAALRWTLERREIELALGISGSLWKFWELHGHLREGRRWLAAALSAFDLAPYAKPRRAKAKALFAAGRLAERQGDNASARPLLEESALMAREIDDRPLIALALHNLSNLSAYEGDYASGRTFAEESLAIRAEMGDRWGMANTLHNLGFQAEAIGEYAVAGAFFERSLAIGRELKDDWGTAYSLDALALIKLEQGDYAPANSLLEESLVLRGGLGDKSGLARSLERLARAAGKQGQSLRAARLFGAAEALREQEDIPIMPVDRPIYQQTVAQAHANLNEDEWRTAWGEGRVMSVQRAIDYALYPREDRISISALTQ